MQPTTTHTLVTTTCPDRASAERVAQALLEKNLAACLQLSQIESYYRWEGETRHEPEIRLTLKTRTALLDDLEAAIRATHPYNCPQILATPITHGHAPYLTWLDENTEA